MKNTIKSNWGGARERKTKREPTTVKRIPNSLLPKIELLITKHKSKVRKINQQ